MRNFARQLIAADNDWADQLRSPWDTTPRWLRRVEDTAVRAFGAAAVLGVATVIGVAVVTVARI
jgi:hypothetical protein